MDRRTLLRVAGRGSTGVGSSRPTYIFSPEGATFATGGFPTLRRNDVTWPDYTLDYSATTVQAAYWYVGIPNGADFNGGVLEVFSRFGSVATGTLGWTITTRAVGNGTAWSASGVVTTITNGLIPGTACQVFRQQVTITASGWGQSKILQVKIARNATGDTAAGVAKFGKALLRLTRDGI